MPKRLSEVTENLHKDSGAAIEKVAQELKNLLQWAEKLNIDAVKNSTGKSFLPFRFHQFISQTNTVHVTLDPLNEREITIKSGRYVKDDDASEDDKFIYPVLFSRYSGHEFICVAKNFESNTLEPRDPSETPQNLTFAEAKKKELTEKDFVDGYLIIPQDDADEIWSSEFEEDLPDNWWKPKKSSRELHPFYRLQIPHKIYFNNFGKFSNQPVYEQWGWYISAKLRIDPTAGVIYEDVKTNENTKLMRLGNEGRSTATTIMAFSVIDALNKQGELLSNQKLLSFTVNSFLYLSIIVLTLRL